MAEWDSIMTGLCSLPSPDFYPFAREVNAKTAFLLGKKRCGYCRVSSRT